MPGDAIYIVRFSKGCTLITKNFGQFKFRTKACPKLKLSEIFNVRKLKASEIFNWAKFLFLVIVVKTTVYTLFSIPIFDQLITLHGDSEFLIIFFANFFSKEF